MGRPNNTNKFEKRGKGGITAKDGWGALTPILPPNFLGMKVRATHSLFKYSWGPIGRPVQPKTKFFVATEKELKVVVPS